MGAFWGKPFPGLNLQRRSVDQDLNLQLRSMDQEFIAEKMLCDMPNNEEEGWQ